MVLLNNLIIRPTLRNWKKRYTGKVIKTQINKQYRKSLPWSREPSGPRTESPLIKHCLMHYSPTKMFEELNKPALTKMYGNFFHIMFSFTDWKVCSRNFSLGSLPWFNLNVTSIKFTRPNWFTGSHYCIFRIHGLQIWYIFLNLS